MRARWLLVISALALFGAGCESESKSTSTGPTKTADASESPPSESSPQNSPSNKPAPATPPPSAPAPSGCPGGGGVHCASGSYRDGYVVSIPQFRGDRGFVQYSITGIYLEGKPQKYGVVFVSDARGFGGDNWVYVKGIDTIPGRPVGAWKIEAEGQGAETEGGYAGSTNFQPSRTYVVRVEWGPGSVRALIDGQVYTSVSLPRSVVINGLDLAINETPRANVDRPYPGAVISNIVVGQ